jgi:hypothetical protein
MIEFTADEIFKHVRIGHAVCQVEVALDVLTENATVIDATLVQRVIAAFEKFGEARRTLVSPLARAMPASESRN